MPTAASEKIRSRLQEMSAKKEAVLQHLLEDVTYCIHVQRELEKDLREELRKGLEREALLDTLAAVRSPAEVMVEAFRRLLAGAGPVFESHLRESEAFLAWVCDLEARFSKPVPPFDGPNLPPAPDGPAGTAEGYLSVSEARAQLRAGKRA